MCLKFANHPAWNPESKSPRRDIFGDNTSGSDHTAVPYGHPRQDNNIAAYPHIAAYSYRFCEFESHVAACSIKRMPGCIE